MQQAESMSSARMNSIVTLAAIGGVLIGLFDRSAAALVDLELHAVQDVYEVGALVQIELYAVSDSDKKQGISAVDAIVTWDEQSLELLGNNNEGAVPLLLSEFPMPDAHGLNDDLQDGDAFYVAFAPLGEAVFATPEGTLLTTFEFTALSAGQTQINIPATHPSGAETTVFGSESPNDDVTGQLIGETIEIVEPCPADLDGDGQVGVSDLLILLGQWGACDGECVADIDDNGFVEVSDLLDLLAVWGPCS